MFLLSVSPERGLNWVIVAPSATESATRRESLSSAPPRRVISTFPVHRSNCCNRPAYRRTIRSNRTGAVSQMQSRPFRGDQVSHGSANAEVRIVRFPPVRLAEARGNLRGELGSMLSCTDKDHSLWDGMILADNAACSYPPHPPCARASFSSSARGHPRAGVEIANRRSHWLSPAQLGLQPNLRLERGY